MRYRATILPSLVPLANLVLFGSSSLTFFKIFLAVAAMVCVAVLILRILGRLLIDLFGILDARAPGSHDRYA